MIHEAYNLRTEYPVLQWPHSCPTINENEILILFGIKSTPRGSKRRDAIRQTWGNRTNWDFSDHPLLTGNKRITVHFVFLLGVGNLLDNNSVTSDILQGDFLDTFTNLTIKGMACYTYYVKQLFNNIVVMSH